MAIILEGFDGLTRCISLHLARCNVAVRPAGSEWRTDGLRTRLERDGQGVVCESDHLTPFTLLLDPYPRRGLGGMLLAMDVITYLGSALSVVGLLATIVTYQFLSR